VRILDFLFGPDALTGREGDNRLTEDERRRLRGPPVILEKPHLQLLELPHLDRIVAAAPYDMPNLLKDALHAFKYDRVRWLAEELGAVLAEASFIAVPGVEAPWEPEQFPELCPVPLHWTRRFQRGFNQAEMLARIVASNRGWPMKKMLRRARPTGHQAWRDRAERLTAVRDAFVVRSRSTRDFVILVDDIATTGATLNACAQALKHAGVERVEGLVVAHG
jgi:ComF family protein